MAFHWHSSPHRPHPGERSGSITAVPGQISCAYVFGWILAVCARHDFRSGNKVVIDPDRCTGCGLCGELCQWNAISRDFVVDEISCEGCGVCVKFCPEQAVDFPEKTCGEWYVSDTRFGPLVHARLGIAKENSGKLVSLVRREARALAEGAQCDLNHHRRTSRHRLPGHRFHRRRHCGPGGDEPSVSGRHDMDRVIRPAGHFNVPAFVSVNKYDLHRETSDAIEEFCREAGHPCLGLIPFDPAFTAAMVQGNPSWKPMGKHRPEKRCALCGKTFRAVWKNCPHPIENGQAVRCKPGGSRDSRHFPPLFCWRFPSSSFLWCVYAQPMLVTSQRFPEKRGTGNGRE